MASFDDFRDAIKAGLGKLVAELADHKDEILEASEKFLEASEADLKDWTRQLADGDLSQGDFEFLVKGKKDLAEVHLNTQIGLAKVALDKFREALIDLISDTAKDVFL